MSTYFVARYDFRSPGLEPAARQELFSRAVAQVAHLDAAGWDSVVVSEHHASEDGYLPSPLPVAGAFAAVSSRIPISVSALLANLYDPVRLAEDMSVLSHLSAGRVGYTFGLGYREEEYAHLGRPWASRGADLEERIQVVTALLAGEEVTFEGRTTRVFPQPFALPFLLYGGGSPAAARRAGRLGLHFQPQRRDRDLAELYRETCREHGREPGLVVSPPAGPTSVFAAADPDEFWERWGEHLLADARGYYRWKPPTRGEGAVLDAAETVEDLRAGDVYLVATPDDLVERCRAGEIRALSTHPGCGGLPTDPSWESLRLISESVIPAVRG
ncbi:MAG: LLM class flavin-dependent oxidoreductase [Nocardioides sp.]|uniref:LLM class flavin-dependent oxidoreductase n=1 Tax=Nocardioides sp. TaxID=35761 RepID=UPI003EFE5820